MTETKAPSRQNRAPRAGNRHGARRGSAAGHRPGQQKAAQVYAALDLGTNNCRLLVARPSKTGLRVVDAFSRIVRLGEGLSRSRRLGEAAMQRTLQALHVCKVKLDNNGVTRARLVATEACRVAENGAEFAVLVKERLGLELEIIDQQTEAFLAVAGCASLVDARAESCIVFDIGGGSTEIAWLKGRLPDRFSDPAEHIAAWASLNAGVVTLAEHHGGLDVTWDGYEAMVAEVEDMLAPFVEKAREASKAPYFHLLGTSGTVTTLGGIYLGLPKYDRRRVDGLWMSDEDMSAVIGRLLDMSYEERAANACISRERADLVLAGCAILDAIRRAFPARFLRIADRGLREGILMKMMREDGVWRQA